MPELFNAADYLVGRQLRLGAGDRVAVTGPQGTLTYAELGDLVQRTAAGLRAAGLRPEERVMLFTSDSPRMLALLLGAMWCGAVPVPVSTMYRGGELAELIRDSRARMLVVSPEFTGIAAQALDDAPDLAGVLTTEGPALGTPEGVTALTWDDLLAAGEPHAADGPYHTVDDSPALWLYTSGTTGTPKAAMHRHANIRHVVETYGTQVLGIKPDDRCFSVAKLFFAYGLGNSCFFPLSVGASVVLDAARPTPAAIAGRVAADRPTLFFSAPTTFAALLHAEDVPADAFASVRLAVSAGEPLPAGVYERFLKRFGVEILDGIGSTEALHIFLSNRPGGIVPGSTGTAVPGYRLRIVTEAGHEAEPGEPGVLQLNGPSLATGYWARTQTTRAVFRGEWLVTGDVYVRDEDGYYTCLGRDNDMIKAGGIWVSPAEVEARLLEHPSVAQAAVVGVPDEDGLDKPVACIVAAPGFTPDPDELIAFCRCTLASFKRPRHVLAFDALPTTATGKIRRHVLRHEVRDRLAP